MRCSRSFIGMDSVHASRARSMRSRFAMMLRASSLLRGVGITVLSLMDAGKRWYVPVHNTSIAVTKSASLIRAFGKIFRTCVRPENASSWAHCCSTSSATTFRARWSNLASFVHRTMTSSLTKRRRNSSAAVNILARLASLDSDGSVSLRLWIT